MSYGYSGPVVFQYALNKLIYTRRQGRLTRPGPESPGPRVTAKVSISLFKLTEKLIYVDKLKYTCPIAVRNAIKLTTSE